MHRRVRNWSKNQQLRPNIANKKLENHQPQTKDREKSENWLIHTSPAGKCQSSWDICLRVSKRPRERWTPGSVHTTPRQHESLLYISGSLLIRTHFFPKYKFIQRKRNPSFFSLPLSPVLLCRQFENCSVKTFLPTSCTQWLPASKRSTIPEKISFSPFAQFIYKSVHVFEKKKTGWQVNTFKFCRHHCSGCSSKCQVCTLLLFLVGSNLCSLVQWKQILSKKLRTQYTQNFHKHILETQFKIAATYPPHKQSDCFSCSAVLHKLNEAHDWEWLKQTKWIQKRRVHLVCVNPKVCKTGMSWYSDTRRIRKFFCHCPPFSFNRPEFSFCKAPACVYSKEGPIHTGPGMRRATQANGTCWCEWGCPHCTKQHQMKNVPNCACIASCGLCGLGLNTF